jgi:hypothetical protein
MLECAAWHKNLHKRLKIVGIIAGKYLKNVKLTCFTRLTKNLYVSRPSTAQTSLKDISEKKNM